MKQSEFRNIFARVAIVCPVHCFFFLIVIFHCGFACAQTNPTAIQIPVAEDFTNNWLKSSGIPSGFAVWTSAGAPRTSNTSASISNANGDESTFDSATVVKSPGKAYGYSAIGACKLC